MDATLENCRVVVGLSGGVDSAVAALLLKRAGADVHALHMTNWEDADGYCDAAADLQDARSVGQQLAIPFHHVNFAREYRDRVFDYFLDEYRRGRTPNPDVLCNREIKFGVFRDYAMRLGAEVIATGHYARTRTVEGTTVLLKGTDRNKDQSYFLHAVSARALAGVIFPLGELDKGEVRDLARRHGLAVHDKKDSTGICFIGERPFREFLGQYLPAQPGPIVNPSGKEVGRHHGLMFYTLGQRQGLGIGGLADAGTAPWYVVAKRLEDNALVVAQGETDLLLSHELVACGASWIGSAPMELERGFECFAKIRYRQDDQACRVMLENDAALRVTFEEPQRAATPGQFVVFYSGERCLGGAVIDRVLRRAGADEFACAAAF